MQHAPAYIIDQALDASFQKALQRLAERQATVRATPLKPIQQVTPMSLSAQAIKLAHKYMGIVEKYDNDYTDAGYTPREMELIRTKAHNALIEQLRAEGIDTSDRAATTELARLAEQWLRD